ncbi:tyrosine-protein kinase STYK1b isoform X1 [Xiphophorus hellerii]|uniref:tyrosine-protein kinase STYK1b isoform X1 n=2 Tax=Xiphophorus hellerii TaxID=8084 RepID=UPI0013B35A26|nr:tyrosine-protein kinase STYK1-like isoform X1 [Xiphophorus hellerii]
MCVAGSVPECLFNLFQSDRMSGSDPRCTHGATVCEIRVYEPEVIVVPILLLASFLVTLVFILLLRYCPEKVDRIRPRKKMTTRRILQGIDAPPGLNVLEHESIALDIPTSYSTFDASKTYQSQRFPAAMSNPAPSPRPLLDPIKTSFTPIVQPRELPRQRLPESFNLVAPLQGSFSLRVDTSVSLYRARMENRNVVLRVLKDSADADERHDFLGFASFLSQLGPHPFLPELLGVVSIRAPLVTVVEELENRDLLSYLWQCRQDKVDPPCEMTERRIFTMGSQVASALEFLHSKDLLHGNIRARSVLVTKLLTAKLWGLHGVYIRKSKKATQRDDPSMKKWQAPELLVRKAATKSSDIWSFGILLFEMASLGDAPFAEISINEVLQFHQRGKNLKKPSNCSNSLYALIKSCCQWKEQDRPLLAELSRKLVSGEKGASDKVLKASGTVNLEQYLQEAGYGEANSYTVL